MSWSSKVKLCLWLRFIHGIDTDRHQQTNRKPPDTPEIGRATRETEGGRERERGRGEEEQGRKEERRGETEGERERETALK